MRSFVAIALLGVLFGLSACSDSSEDNKETTAPTATQSSATEQTAEKPAAQEPAVKQARQTEPDTETVTNDACVAAVKKETGESNVSVQSNEFSEANTIVMIGVGNNNAPWKCLVANDGGVQEVTFTGDDSAGVPQAESSEATDSSSDVSDAAIDACLKAVSAETSEPNVSAMSTEFSEANSIVMVGVGVQRAPWKCLVSNDGDVAEVSFTGDEGKL